MEQFKEHLGRAIRACRQAEGISQEELAARVDRATVSISEIERGLSAPSTETLFRLSEALHMPLDSLKAILSDKEDSHLSSELVALRAEAMQLVSKFDEASLRAAIAAIKAVGMVK